MTEDEKKAKRSKIEENKHKRIRLTNCSSKVADSTTGNATNINPSNLSTSGMINSPDDTRSQMTPKSVLSEIGVSPGSVHFSDSSIINGSLAIDSFAINRMFTEIDSSVPASAIGGCGVPRELDLNQAENSQDYDIEAGNSALRSLLTQADMTDSSLSSPPSPQMSGSLTELSPMTNPSTVEYCSLSSANSKALTPLSLEGDLCSENMQLATCDKSNDKSCDTNCTIPESVFRQTVEVEFAPIPIRQRNSIDGTSFNRYELNDLERGKLQELISANDVFKSPYSSAVIPDPSLLDVIKMTEYAIRRLIKMSKKLDCFKNFCQQDQIALLKGGCTEMMILRSKFRNVYCKKKLLNYSIYISGAMTYNQEKECWQVSNLDNIIYFKL